MAKQIKTRRAPAKAGIEAHDLFLAGLGAVSLTRKQGIKLYDTLLVEGKQFQGRIEQTIESLQDQAKLGAEIVRERVEAIVTPIRARAEATLGTVKGELETRLAPVLDKLGMKAPAKTRARTAAKRPVRKAKAPAKRATRKSRAA
jgi:hypothetical protein